MSSSKAPSGRRTDPLSRERLVKTAIRILDEEGEDALTFRLLAARLATGPGAIYHHVSNKDELLRAATAEVITAALDGAPEDEEVASAMTGNALAVFDAIHEHPWTGAQLSREPWGIAVIRLFETFGQLVHRSGIPATAQFDATSAIVNAILGLAVQYAAGARLLGPRTDRAEFLRGIAAQWEHLDPVQFPFMHSVAPGLETHSDRLQFIAGIEIVLRGIQSVRARPGSSTSAG